MVTIENKNNQTKQKKSTIPHFWDININLKVAKNHHNNP